MLVEIQNVRQIPGEDFRKWYVDENTDLIVWFDTPRENITGFQFCFDKKSVQRCLTWQKSGDGRPVLSADGRYSKTRVLRIFNSISEGLPEDLRDLVREALI